MLPRVWAYIAGLLAVIGTALAIYFRGRNAGQNAERLEQAQSDLKLEQAKNDIIQTAHEIQSDVERLPASDVRKRLRDTYTRD